MNVLCREGEIVAYTVQQRGARSFRLLDSADLLENVRRAVRAAGFHGTANFDTIISETDGLGYLLECNPRFFYTIYMSAVLGVNFVDAAMRLELEPDLVLPGRSDVAIRLNRDLFVSPLRPWGISRDEWRMLGYHAADPIPILCDRFDLLLGGQVGVPHELMSQYVGEETREAALAQ